MLAQGWGGKNYPRNSYSRDKRDRFLLNSLPPIRNEDDTFRGVLRKFLSEEFRKLLKSRRETYETIIFENTWSKIRLKLIENMTREDFSIALLKLNPSATFVSPPFPLLLLLLLLFALPFLARRIGTKADVKLGKLNETTAREGATFRRRGGVSRKFSTYLLHEPYTSYLCVCICIYVLYIYIEREREKDGRTLANAPLLFPADLLRRMKSRNGRVLREAGTGVQRVFSFFFLSSVSFIRVTFREIRERSFDPLFFVPLNLRRKKKVMQKF